MTRAERVSHDPPPSATLELVEREAWLDLFAAAPDSCTRSLGLKSCRLGTMGLLACREVTITEFNRAMCVGAVEPATEL
jgi:hypothetical protein